MTNSSTIVSNESELLLTTPLADVKFTKARTNFVEYNRLPNSMDMLDTMMAMAPGKNKAQQPMRSSSMLRERLGPVMPTQPIYQSDKLMMGRKMGNGSASYQLDKM